MEILKNKIVDVSTSKKAKKALKVLRMFNQRIITSCGYYLENSAHPVTKYIALGDLYTWDYVPFISNWNQHDIIQPSELKKILAKELLKEDDAVIIEGPKPKRARYIVSINKVEYYGDAGLKFLTHYGTGLNNPSYRHGSAFSGKFIRFATNDEVAKLVEEVAINQNKKPQCSKYNLYDSSILRKTCFIPFSSIYSQLPTITPLPPFIDILKMDMELRRKKLSEEINKLCADQPSSDLGDVIAQYLERVNFKIIDPNNPTK